MGNLRFSVVIPAFNRANLLRDCLESVFKQSYPNFEIIVVDDGSTDNTPAVLAQYKDRIHAIRQDNQGQATARNTGIDVARGDYIAFLDCDDVWFPWTLETFKAVIQKHDLPAVIMGKPLPFQNDIELKDAKNDLLETSAFADFLMAYTSSQGFVGSCAMVIRREALGEQVRFPPVRQNAEDLDFLIKLSTACGFVWVQEPNTLGYRQHTSNSILNHISTVKGMIFLIKQERRGAYPGGQARAAERRKIIHTWAHDWQHRCMADGNLRLAFKLYRARLPWLWQEKSYAEIRLFPEFALRRPLGRLKRWLWSKLSRPKST